MPNLNSIAYKNLWRKRIRTVLTLLGISLSSWVLISLLGFNKGYERSLDSDIDNLGYQVLLTAKGCPYEAATLMLQGGTGLRYMPESIVDSLATDKEVDELTPMLMQAAFNPDQGESGGITAYTGIDPKTFPKMRSYLEFAQGGWFKNNTALEAVVGYEAAELEQREVGDLLLIPGKDVELKVVGILKRSGTQDDGTIFVPYKTLQSIFGVQGKLTSIGIKVHPETNVSAFEEKLYLLPDVQVVSMAQVKTTILIAMVGVINTILMSVFERYQEIGIMKSMGASAWHIFRLIWTETVIICFAGGVLGALMSYILAKLTDSLIRYILPYAPRGALVLIDLPLVWRSMLIEIGIGLISGIYPAARAAGIKPIEAIKRSEGEL